MSTRTASSIQRSAGFETADKIPATQGSHLIVGHIPDPAKLTEPIAADPGISGKGRTSVADEEGREALYQWFDAVIVVHTAVGQNDGIAKIRDRMGRQR